MKAAIIIFSLSIIAIIGIMIALAWFVVEIFLYHEGKERESQKRSQRKRDQV